MGGIPKELYQQIRKDVDIPVMCCAHLGYLTAKYPGVDGDTICAILAQENQYKVIKHHHIHKANMNSYCSRYISGEDVLDICADVDFPPCLMMRGMLELLLKLGKQRVSDVLKDPAMLEALDRQSCLQEYMTTTVAAQRQVQPQPQHRLQQQHKQHHRQQGQQHKQKEQAADTPAAAAVLQRLQVDVVRCVHADSSYSPYCDMAKSLAGLEHEAKLYAQLHEADIPFWTEQQLRQKGLFKTPDALLQVPICVRCEPAGQWHLVHWIDSKASFGDERTHSSQLEGQYRTYINRYGPGLVIYWFGFLSDMENDAEVLMLDAFPTLANLMQLPRLQLTELATEATDAGGSSAVVAATDATVATASADVVSRTATGAAPVLLMA